MTRGLAAATATACVAAVGVWLALLLFTITAPGGRCLPTGDQGAVVPATSIPGPPVPQHQDWRPPQHRWETPK